MGAVLDGDHLRARVHAARGTTSSGWPGTWPCRGGGGAARRWAGAGLPDPGLLPPGGRDERVPGRPGIQSLTANDDGVGIPRCWSSRHALVASAPADALRRATLLGRAGGYGHSFAFGSGSAMSIETSATRFAVNGQPGSHTGQPLHRHRSWPNGPRHPARAARPAWPGSRSWSSERSPATPPPSARSWPTTAAAPQTICEQGRRRGRRTRLGGPRPGRRGGGDRLLDDLRPRPGADVGGAGQLLCHRL